MSNLTTDVEISEEERLGGQVEAIIGIVIIIVGVLSSLLLVICTAYQRILRAPFYIVMASWALSNLICSAFMVVHVIDLWHHSSSRHGGLCNSFEYLSQAVVLVRLYHMPLAGIVACFCRTFPTWFRSCSWANVVVPIILCLYVWAAFFILATPYIGSMELVQNIQGKFACVLWNYDLYWVPLILSFIILINLECAFVRRPGEIHVHGRRMENSDRIILFIVVPVCVVSKLALLVFHYSTTDMWFSGYVGIWLLVSHIVSIVASLDYCLAPLLCLLFVALYRNIFCLPCRGQDDVRETPGEPPAISL